ncbi:hypothetical protein CDAR_416171 [Caerostris darwini]|uniref:Uncharacterized protein n=1 Tax=Caerostris darwini TaxID=1538125 RepID=A0AAV4W736_9ARAC|nr:hypothetical protein CDAR_416171 [Caerostris darwini]
MMSYRLWHSSLLTDVNDHPVDMHNLKKRTTIFHPMKVSPISASVTPGGAEPPTDIPNIQRNVNCFVTSGIANCIYNDHCLVNWLSLVSLALRAVDSHRGV